LIEWRGAIVEQENTPPQNEGVVFNREVTGRATDCHWKEENTPLGNEEVVIERSQEGHRPSPKAREHPLTE
jgi:hypothetical protein